MPYLAFLERVTMMTVLKAEESLRRVTEVALGNGLIEKAERRVILGAWRREANMGSSKKQTTLDSLVGNGIGLIFVRKGEHHAG